MIIDSARLRGRIQRILDISADPKGGYTRLAFSQKDLEARALVKEMMAEAGLTVRQDAAGNIIGSFAPRGVSGGVIATGSHVDTVRNGGKFDGLLGVIGAIEAAQCLREKGVEPKHPLEVIVFSDEEGARFNSSMIGSKSIVGVPMEHPLDQYVDSDGVSCLKAMKDAGFAPDRLEEAKAAPGYYKAFVELHIEQGFILERAGKRVGVVDGIKGPYWLRGSFTGQSNHAGSTPMDSRRDPMVAAANFIAEVDRIAKAQGGVFVATVGTMKVTPGGINTIPSKVEFSIDVRDIDHARRQDGVEKIQAAAQRAAEQFDVQSSLVCVKDTPPGAMSPWVMEAIEAVCREQGAEYMQISSGAFHDALTMIDLCDVGMIFVPSIGGVSHSPEEDTDWEDVYQGVDILYHTLAKLLTQE